MEEEKSGQGGQDIADGGQRNDERDFSERQKFHQNPEVKGFKSCSKQNERRGEELEEDSGKVRGAQKAPGRWTLEEPLLDQNESPGFGGETDRHEQENIPEGFRVWSGHGVAFVQ